MPVIIDGQEIANIIKENLQKEITKFNLHPTLAIILANDNPASEIYVRNKKQACDKIGMNCEIYRFYENSSEEEIITLIKKLNNDSKVDGIIVQSPVYPVFNEAKIMSFIAADKDVDGFGITNMGNLALNNEDFISATPLGIITMLEKEQIPIAGTHVVIIGRSKIVGRPLALALLNRDATVTICHSKTKNLKDLTKTADILVVAIGKPNFITADYLKEGAVVIDVGINKVNTKLCGDVDFASCAPKCSYITKVPGGVGPMTIAMLLSNCVLSAKRRNKG